MIREDIDYAIECSSPVTITYSKDGFESKIFHLDHVAYSPVFGNNYINAYCQENQKTLTFRIDKILHVEIEWIDVFPHNSCANRDGLYLVTCRSDMHLEFELRNYRRWDNMLDHYQNENGIDSFYSHENLLAYHFIPYYSEENNSEWKPFDTNSDERKPGYYIFAYLLSDEEPQEPDYEELFVERYYGSPKSDFLSPWELTNLKSNGICYTVNDGNGQFDRIRIPSNVTVLAYSYCSYYTEANHANHWNLAEKMGLIK